MNKTPSQLGREQINQIGMSQAEMQNMLARIKATPVESISQAVQTSWRAGTFMSWLRTSKIGYACAIVAVMILVGGSAAFASQGSLPGDVLYPVKINIIEPIKLSFARTPEAQAEVVASQTEARVQEGQTLAAEGELTAERQVELSRLIALQTIALNARLAQVAVSDPTKAESLSVGFQASMDAGAQQLSPAPATPVAVAVSTTSAATNTSVTDLITSVRLSSGSVASSSWRFSSTTRANRQHNNDVNDGSSVPRAIYATTTSYVNTPDKSVATTIIASTTVAAVPAVLATTTPTQGTTTPMTNTTFVGGSIQYSSTIPISEYIPNRPKFGSTTSSATTSSNSSSTFSSASVSTTTTSVISTSTANTSTTTASNTSSTASSTASVTAPVVNTLIQNVTGGIYLNSGSAGGSGAPSGPKFGGP